MSHVSYKLIMMHGLASLALAACATHPPAEQPIKPPAVVNVPGSASCIPADTPPAPVFRDTPQALLDAPDAAERDRLVKGEWFARVARLGLLEMLVANCRS